jgi:hypothetical protein
MSLLASGVPLKAPVAGIAMGLVSGDVDGQHIFKTLTDILGAEDAFGDMDFKVAGTSEFITALQLDTKLDGIPADMLGRGAEAGQGSPHDDPRGHQRVHRLPGRDEPDCSAHHHHQRSCRQDR